MAKRFIDTQVFRKPFIKGLASHHKLLWFYLLAECDHAGIWQVELDVASMRLGQDYDEQECLQAFGDKIQPLCGGTKWFIPDFLDAQYGALNPNWAIHSHVIKTLKKHRLPYTACPVEILSGPVGNPEHYHHPSLSTLNYRAYLRTPYWRSVRQVVLGRDHYQCVECGATKRLYIHHRSYKHRGNEHLHLGDLVTLCFTCHDLTHANNAAQN